MTHSENPVPQAHKLSILLIDDDALMSEMVRYALKSDITNVVLHVYTDIDIQLKNINPSLILVDLNLTSSDGEATLQKIREIFPHHAVIPISGIAPLRIQEWEALYRLEPFLSKDNLLQNLHAIVQKKRT